MDLTDTKTVNKAFATIIMERKYGHILNIQVTSTSMDRVLAIIRGKILRREKFYIVTPNPEIVLQAQNDKKLAQALNYAQISLPDGIGLAQAARFMDLKAPRNKILKAIVLIGQGLSVGLATFLDKKWLFTEISPIKGRQVFVELVRLANKKGWRVFLLGGQSSQAEDSAKALSKNYKKITIKYATGPFLTNGGIPINNEELEKEREAIEMINAFSPQLLFVGFGAPKQEKWLSRWHKSLNIGGGMVVGGTFDYISGKVSMPPGFFERAGLEWVWRLIKEPRRIIRIFKAAVIFPITVFLYKLNLTTAKKA